MNATVERCEDRTLLTGGTWTRVTTNPFDFNGTMELLTDGTVMVQGYNGTGGVSANWYKLSPDAQGNYAGGAWSRLASMNTQRLYYASNIVQSGKLFVYGGEYSGPSGAQNIVNSGEIYDPVADTWTPVTTNPLPVNLAAQNNNSGFNVFGDDPSMLLPNGNILTGYIFGPQTEIYNPTTDSWSAGGTKLNNDRSDEETWATLPNGKVLSFDIFHNTDTGPWTAQLYDPSTNTWSATGNVPVQLSSSAVTQPNGGSTGFYEIGPTLVLPSGKVFQLGATGNTAIYDPAANTWTAGPQIPTLSSDGVRYGADDSPAALTTDGQVIFTADRPYGNGPAHMFDYDPVANTITDITSTLPSGLQTELTNTPAYPDRMLALPNGQVMFNASYNDAWVFTPGGTALTTGAPTITSIANNGSNSYTLTGTQLNGLSSGSSYGDDAESDTNYPIVRLKASNGNVYYARTTNWSLTGVQTGATPETVNFSLPTAIVQSNPVVTPQLISGVVGQALSNVTVATFTDPNGGNHPAASYAASIDWGDGSITTGTVAGPNGSGVYTVTGSHPVFSAANSSLTIKVTATDTYVSYDLMAVASGISSAATNFAPFFTQSSDTYSVSNAAAAPTVIGVTATNAADTYGIGAVITIDVAFSQPVIVTGTPVLQLNSGGWASYTSGSGTSTLVFTYTVAAGQSANPLDEASTGALMLAGGTIKDSGGTAASITVPAPGSASSLSQSHIIIATDPTVGVNVTGLTINDVAGVNGGFGVAPPDTSGAVGPNHFVEFVNGAFAVYNKSDGSLVPTSLISDVSFWTAKAGLTLPAGVSLSNPRILFDPFTQRWFAVEITNDDTANQVLLARSDTADPTGTWQGTKFDANPSPTQGGASGYGDFPTFGLDQAAVYIGVNDFAALSNPTYQGQTIFAIPKADLLLATPSLAHKTDFRQLDPNVVGFTLQPAVNLGSYNGAGMLIAISNTSPTELDQTNVLLQANGTALLSTTTHVTVPQNPFPPTASQPDGTAEIDTGDDRINSSVYAVGNRLYIARTALVNGRAAVHWTIVDVMANAVVGDGVIGDATHDYFNPSIAANQFGEVVIAFNRSGTGAGDFIGSYAIAGATTNGVLAFGQPTLLKAGQDNYHLFGANPEPWGDYSSVSVDPSNPHTFWTFQEYAQPNNVWATQVTQIAFPDTSIPAVTFVGAQPSFGTFKAGQSITVVMDFNEPVTVTGTPTIALNSGGTAVYTSGSGTSQLLFTYNVGAGDNSARLDYTSTSALALNGGTIRDAGSNDAVVTLAAPGAQASLGYDTNIVIDTTAPAVTSVTSTTADGTYTAGNTITITIGFAEPVTVTGQPHLALDSGGTATYASGSGTTTLTFTYTVGATDNSAHLDYSSVAALSLNSGTILDAVGNPAALALPTPGAVGSLGANKNLVVYTSALLINDGDEAYHETGTWGTGVNGGDSGRYRWAASGDGTTTATWQITGLAAGDYNVQLTWLPDTNRATNAPYRIYDGTTLLQTVQVNQQVSPHGPVIGGVPLQHLATVHVSSGTLKIVLGNDANGYVIADAARVTLAPAIDLNWLGTGGGISGPATLPTDTNFTISRTYQITGAATASPFTIAYYASTDSVLGTGNEVLLGTETIPAGQGPNSYTGESPEFQIHGAGTYHLYAVLDPNGAVDETVETNDVIQAPQTVTVSGPPLLVDNGNTGYSVTGTWWQAVNGGYNTNYQYAVAGDGSTAATWQITGLAAGDYNVQVTWLPYSNRATNAPYRIYDGSSATPLQTVLVNQQVAPTGPVVGGVPFQQIVTAHITSGTLRVVLGNDADGQVIADAVRVTPAIDLDWLGAGDGITVSANLATDTDFTVGRTFQITGLAATAAPFTIAYYASTDSTSGNADDVLLGTEIIPAGTSPGNVTGNSPNFQVHTAGTYSYVFALLDTGNGIAETAETNNVFSLQQTVTISGGALIDNGAAGYTDTGAWSGWAGAGGYNGNYRYTGDRTATASWLFTGLANGSYDVQVSWVPSTIVATNAPYSVYGSSDSSNLLQTVVVNQQAAPVGPALGGTEFQPLGTFAVTNGVLKVVLGNGANGWVIADAVRVVPHAATATDVNWGSATVTAPSNANSDTPFTLGDVTYQVSGAAASSDFTIAYYASASASFDPASAILLGTQAITASGNKSVGSHTVTVPALQVRIPGTYYLHAVLDGNGAIDESDETNNVLASGPFTVVGPAYVVAQGDPGYSETGVWTNYGLTGGGYDGGPYRYTAGGTGTSTASWSVTPAPGTYDVQVTWAPYSNRATNAVYSVYNSGSLLGTFTINQQAAPSGSVYGGVPFQSLGGSFTISSGTLQVVLTNNADGSVIADAVRIVSTTGAPVSLSGTPIGAITSPATTTPPSVVDTGQAVPLSAASPEPTAPSTPTLLSSVDAALAQWQPDMMTVPATAQSTAPVVVFLGDTPGATSSMLAADSPIPAGALFRSRKKR